MKLDKRDQPLLLLFSLCHYESSLMLISPEINRLTAMAITFFIRQNLNCFNFCTFCIFVFYMQSNKNRIMQVFFYHRFGWELWKLIFVRNQHKWLPHFTALIDSNVIFKACFPPWFPFLTNIKLLLYHYFHGKDSDKLHSLVAQVQTFIAKTFFATSTGLNQPHFLYFSFVTKKFHSERFSSRTATLWKIFLYRCISKH